MVEHLSHKEAVAGSIPVVATKFLGHPDGLDSGFATLKRGIVTVMLHQVLRPVSSKLEHPTDNWETAESYRDWLPNTRP
jgi:hypothetical protein